MPLIDVKYQPGTQKSPQQTKLSLATFVDTNRVHFPDGLLRSIPQWIADTPSNISVLGGCRSIYAHQITGTYVGTYYFFGTNTRLYVVKDNTIFNITPLVTTATATLGSNPIATVNTSATVTVTYTAHDLTVGDRIKIDGATSVAGIPVNQLNAEHIVTATPTLDTFEINVSSAATSTATGGGSSIEIFKQIAQGNLNQGIASGFGAGLWGSGLWGVGGATPSLLQYPRIWSFAPFGNQVVMCPGDYIAGDGQKIYIWDGDTDVAPTALSNAPTDVNLVTVINNSVVSLAGAFIKNSSIGDATEWTASGSTTAFSVQIQRVPRLISVAPYGAKSALVYSEDEVLRLDFVGDPDYWDIETVSNEDGIISPQGWTVLNDVVYWMGRNGFYRFTGSYVEKLKNIQNEDWILANLNRSQQYKVFAWADVDNEEIYFHFPLTVDNEPCDYVIYNISNQSWTLGKLDRTAAQRPASVGSKFYLADSHNESSSGTLYRHFVENPSLDIGWEAKTADAYGQSDKRMHIQEFLPDSNQSGDISLKLGTKEFAQGDEVQTSNYTITPTTTNIHTRAGGRIRNITLSGEKAFTFGGWKERIDYA